jgi:hypothetical protein
MSLIVFFIVFIVKEYARLAFSWQTLLFVSFDIILRLEKML